MGALGAEEVAQIAGRAGRFRDDGAFGETGECPPFDHETIERVQNGLNPGLSIHGVVLTMFDPRNNLANDVAAEVRKHFHVYETIIPRNIRLAEAPSHGKPVILYDAASRGSFQYLNLAREILDALPIQAA